LKELEQIPGAWRKISEGLWDLGLHSIAELRNHDPELLRWWNWSDENMEKRKK